MEPPTTTGDTMKTITFRTAAQAALFEVELKGQLSDGHWENDRRSCWQTWCSAEVRVGTEVGRDFYVNRVNFKLDDPELLGVVGERMRLFAVLARAGYSIGQIRELEGAWNTIGDCSWRGMPTCEDMGASSYWAKVRACLAEYDLELVRRQAENGLAVYGMKELRADLREMKKAMRTMVTRPVTAQEAVS